MAATGRQVGQRCRHGRCTVFLCTKRERDLTTVSHKMESFMPLRNVLITQAAHLLSSTAVFAGELF